MNPEERSGSGEFEGLPEADVADLADIIIRYNAEFGWENLVKNSLKGEWIRPEDNTFGEEDFELAYKRIEYRYNDLLVNLGLKLSLSDEDGYVILNNREGGMKKICVHLFNRKNFINYLGTLSRDSIKPEQVLALHYIMNIMTRQISNYSLATADNNPFVELMSGASSIISEYKRLSGELDKAVAPLEKYLSYARAGCIKEYIAAEKVGLHKPFDNTEVSLFWDIDTKESELKRDWDNIFNALQIIYENEKAKDIYSQAIKTAKDALDFAKQDLTSKAESENYYESRAAKKLLPLFQAVEAQLSEY